MNTMTEQDVKERIASIDKELEDNKGYDGPHEAPAAEQHDDDMTGLYIDVLKAIAEGASDPVALAKAALRL